MWIQAMGRWITLPGRISVSIIGYRSAILESTAAKELYIKALTITIWFAMFFIVGVTHSSTAEVILSSSVNVVSKVLNHGATESSPVGAVIMLALFILLVIPMAAILYAVVMGGLVKSLNTIFGESCETKIDTPRSFYDFLRDTLHRFGPSYNHVRTISLLFLVNVALMSQFAASASLNTANPEPLSPTYHTMLATLRAIILFIGVALSSPFVMAKVRQFVARRQAAEQVEAH